jgi:hypothetical protein
MNFLGTNTVRAIDMRQKAKAIKESETAPMFIKKP